MSKIMRKIKKERIDQKITIPADGSTSYMVLVKRDDGRTWYSCGEFIDNEEDALLYAASDDLLEVARGVLDYQRMAGYGKDDPALLDLCYDAQKAINRATAGERGGNDE